MQVSADSPTFRVAQCPVDESPQAGAAKLTPMIIHGPPGRKIARGMTDPVPALQAEVKQRLGAAVLRTQYRSLTGTRITIQDLAKNPPAVVGGVGLLD
ncbi:MAG: hypothetical protein C5B60_06090 [Chloroflexi bacterium]|nr:MAG: hypothetical protein C5B60_06090 [Chloroflexota bacterium]